MAKYTEKQLDKQFHAKFEQSDEFSAWFLNRTKFAGRATRLILLRSNHPWYQSKKTGVQSETDILIVLEDVNTRGRFAVHVESKLANGKFEPNQPELYHERAADWRGMAKYGAYDDYEVVLIAPRVFYDRYHEQSKIFHRYVPHEDIAHFIPEFGGLVAA